jgi:tetratricopeptide (TPR) repeat protein
MAKKRKNSGAKPAAPSNLGDKPKLRVETTSPPKREVPVFWFGFEVSWAKLAVARVALFGLLALDALLEIRHAPRYGAGGFNVAQLPGLDVLGATRTSYAVCELINAYLFTLAAFGVATRWVLPVATAIYAWLYFGSQLDSYQHHYLVSLILLLACFVPWRRPRDATPATPVASWALRLILVELAIMYLWAAISKMNAAWIDGRTLGGQIVGLMRHFVDATVGIALASKLVILVELTLACTVWQQRWWIIAAPLGLAFHVGILFSGLEIGLFAWLMLALYLLVVPDRFWIAVATSPPVRGVRVAFEVVRGWFDGSAGWLVWLLGAGLGLAFAMITRFEYAGRFGLIALVAMIAGTGYAVIRAPQARRLTAIGLAHLAAMSLWLVTDRASTVATDYYRFWGGTSRRLGDTAAAERAYRELIDVAPDDPAGYFQLGRMLLAQGKADEALAQLHEAQRLSPGDARPFTAEARWLASRGRTADAISKARDATITAPNDKDARELLDSLTRGRPPPADTSTTP